MRVLWTLLTASALVVDVTGAQPTPAPITRALLEKSVFQSIRAMAENPPRLAIRFKEAGARFLCMRDGREDKVNDYGETMSIKLGEDFSMSEAHASLEFKPLPKPLDRKGWLIEVDADARSFGGDKSTSYGIVLIAGKPESPELRFVEPEKNFDPKLPPTDPTFQKLQTILAATDPLSRHDLTAETASGEAKPPFPASVSALHFHWEKKGGAPPDPLEVRWIAENVRGAEKNHLIVTSKSESDKTEGEFNLKKPTAGFPPGQYRVEIWQSGKMIYSEKFEIKGD
jgi:hypothetical protein